MGSLQGSWRVAKKIARWGFPASTYKPGTVVMRVLAPSLERHMGGRQALIAYTLAVALAILWTLGIGVAFAAAALDSGSGNAMSSLISQPQDALALRWLRDLFGPVSVLQGGVSGDSTATVLTRILAHINAATMAIGGILLLYGLFVAVAQTAHEGEPLGKRFSSLWVPIRLPLGIAMLIPLQATGGLSSSQLAVLWMATQGSGLAEKAWEITVDKIGDGDGTMGGSSIAAPDAAARQVLLSAACVETINQGLQKEDMAGRSSATTTTTKRVEGKGFFGVNSVTEETTTTVSWGGLGANGIEIDACGRISWVSAVNIKDDASAREAGKQRAEYALTKAAVAAQDKAMRALIGDIERIGSRAAAIALPNVPETGKPSAAEVTSAVERYKARYFAELDKAVGNADKELKVALKEEAKRGGWVYAGLYYQAKSAMAGQSQSLANRQPQVSAGPTLRGIPDPLAGYVKGAIEIADTAWRAGHTGAGAPNPSIMARAASGPIGQRGSDSDMAQTAGEAEAQIAGWIGGSVRSLLDHVGGKEASDPLARLISLGKSLTAVGTGIWLAPAVVAGIPVIGGMVGYLSGGITTVGFLMISAGIILGVVVPVMVACMWMYGVLGWLMSVIKAVVGASLWALAHLSLEGDGIEGSRGGNGYMLLLTITCRPILMLAGLMASLIMLRPAVEYTTAGLASLMQSVAPDSLTGILFIVGFALAYAGFLLSVVYLVFGLVNQVPEQVMSWIGGHARGESMDSKSAYGAAAIATRASDAAQSIKYGRSGKDKDDGKPITVGSMSQHIPNSTGGTEGSKQ